jgi:hypothetical protein
MHRNEYLASRLQEVFIDGKFIAYTNFNELIESVTWQQAVIKIHNLNSIAALTFHINYYLDGILNVFNGGSLDIKDKYSFDMAPITSENDWSILKEKFLSNASKFIHHVKSMQDSQFDQPFVDEKYGSYLRNIEGVIEHSYYHLGQISIIKKMILSAE